MKHENLNPSSQFRADHHTKHEIRQTHAECEIGNCATSEIVIDVHVYVPINYIRNRHYDFLNHQ